MNQTTRPHRGWSALYAGLTSLGALSLVETRAAVFAVLLLIIGLAQVSSSSVLDASRSRFWTRVLSIGLGLSILGLGRFIFQEALPGISEAKGRDSNKRAVSLLREIYFAQNAMRRYGMVDPDGDGVGSAGRLGELTGVVKARGTIQLETPPLAPRLAPRTDTRSGPATEHEGYLFFACLPKPGGGWSARSDAKVDEERAERNWIAYAWPMASNLPHKKAYAIDEHEGIYELDNLNQKELVYVGGLHPPPCDSLPKAESDKWKPWNGKTRLEGLPGDKPDNR